MIAWREFAEAGMNRPEPVDLNRQIQLVSHFLAYDRRFHGPVRAREALASSYNVPAVELVEQLGAGALLATLHRAGFVSLDRSAEHYGLGLALGNGDVTLLELGQHIATTLEGEKLGPITASVT